MYSACKMQERNCQITKLTLSTIQKQELLIWLSTFYLHCNAMIRTALNQGPIVVACKKQVTSKT